MTEYSLLDMASDKGLSGEVWRTPEAPRATNDLFNFALATNEEVATDLIQVPDSLFASTELAQASRSKIQFLHRPGQDDTDHPEPRSRSWPAAPRRYALSYLDTFIESFQRRSDRLKVTRDQASAIRSQLKFLRENYRQQHKHVDESQRTLHDRIDAMVNSLSKSDDFDRSRNDYLLYYGQARGDYIQLYEQSLELQALEDELTRVETSIKEQETQWNKKTEKIIGLLRHFNPDTRDEGEEVDVPNTVAAPAEQYFSDDEEEPEDDREGTRSSNGHPLLEQYFDKAGDVKVAKGRLAELLKEQDDERRNRNFQEDQGITFEIPEAEFERDCKRKSDAATKAIRDTIALRDIARNECLKHGIDPNLYRHTSEAFDEYPEDVAVIMTETGPLGETVVVDGKEPDLPQVTENVEKWMESMEPDHISTLIDQVIPEESTPKNKSPSQADMLRQDLLQYFGRWSHRMHPDTMGELSNNIGLELPAAAKQNLEQRDRDARSSTMSNHSRSSSESKISYLRRLGAPHDQLISGIYPAVMRGRPP